MHALCERTRSHNPTLWVVTTTGDQHCRALHGMSKRERNSGLRALPAHAPALKAASKKLLAKWDESQVFFFKKPALKLLSAGFQPRFRRALRALGAVLGPRGAGFERPQSWVRRAFAGPESYPQNHREGTVSTCDTALARLLAA